MNLSIAIEWQPRKKRTTDLYVLYMQSDRIQDRNRLPETLNQKAQPRSAQRSALVDLILISYQIPSFMAELTDLLWQRPQIQYIFQHLQMFLKPSRSHTWPVHLDLMMFSLPSKPQHPKENLESPSKYPKFELEALHMSEPSEPGANMMIGM